MLLLEGFYALFYTGEVSSGYAVLVLKGGIIAGADVSGGLYDGQYTVNYDQKNLNGTLRLTIPAGIALVTGAPASEETSTQDIPFSLPLDFADERVLQVQTATGPINLRFKKIRDFPA
jgi:hypothetical protein